ncbi:unnamed protein product [Adineta steineri]|uniref:ADP ribosyltransferase domain-containing protein n=1 Tax=Adineta steineri TaxID=433720 RepID=A0A818SB20_9BILA|nr:unnamed protein product [Adineta steineri]
MATKPSTSNKASLSHNNNGLIHTVTGENKENTTLLWFDPSIGSEEDTERTQQELRSINDFVIFQTDLDKCVAYIQSIANEKIFLITSGSKASEILPQIADLSQIDSIFIFCIQKDKYIDLINIYPKIIGIYVELDDLSQSIREQVKLVDKQIQAFSFFDQNQKSTKDISKQTAEFLWFQLFNHVIIRLPRNQQAKQQMINLCRQYYRGNRKEIQLINDFEREYRSDDAIRWYTKQSFVYQMINKALRTEDIDMLHTFRFFIGDLSERLVREHEKILSSEQQILTFYRGMKIDREECDKMKENQGNLITINGYLSTSRLRTPALTFALKATKRTDVVPVLFHIICDVQKLGNNVVFADVSKFSVFPDEEEVLFDIGVSFKVQSVMKDETYSNLWLIKLETVDESARIVNDYVELNRKQEEEISVTIIFGKLLTSMGKYDQSLNYFQSLLSNESENEDEARIYNNIGSAYRYKALYDDAIKNYQHAIDLMMNTKPEPRIKNSARPIMNMGNVFLDRCELDKALQQYWQSLEITEQYYGKEHLQTAIVLFHIGGVYYEQKDFNRALKYFKQALEIREKRLPSVHIRIAQCLTAIGRVYSDMQELDQALSYHRNALDMFNKLLPSDHNDIASCLINIAIVLHKQQELSTALDYCLSALKIKQKVFGESNSHPQIADTLHRIGSIYEDQKNNTLAQKYYEDSLSMNLKILPDDHPNLLRLKQDVTRLTEKN